MSGRAFKVVAIISTFNEGDLIGRVIEHLVGEGISAYLIDNHSTDDTLEEARKWLGRGLIGVETFPAGEVSVDYAWGEILRRKVELATTLEADWFIHHDADEVRQAPFPGLNLRDALRFVDTLGYNCVDFRTIEFPPTDDSFKPGDDPRTHFQWFEEASIVNRVQRKCWKATGQPVDLESSGGHDASFEGRRVFPIRFILRHYPIRGQNHGLRKVLSERKPRFLASERERGWHVQYDAVKDQGHSFLRNASTLTPFDLDRLRFELLLPSETARAVLDQSHVLESRLGEETRSRLAAQRAVEETEGRARVLAAEVQRLAAEVGREQGRREELDRQLRALLDRGARRPLSHLRRRVSAWRERQRDRRILRGSSLFNAVWYLTLNADVVSSDLDAFDHYLRFGASEGRDPGPDFSTKGYRKANPDVAVSGVNPLIHYERFGRAEGRSMRIWTEGGRPGLNVPVGIVASPSLDGSEYDDIAGAICASLGRSPFVLDWDTGLGLASALSPAVVFSPPVPGLDALPYLDHTVDIVVAKADRQEEARRVAALAVFSCDPGRRRLRREWVAALTAPARSAVSIVIPVHNHSTTTDGCLAAVLATLPSGFRGEVLVVDDASTDETPDMLARWASRDQRIRVLSNLENLGFIKACNRGAEEASGEILVFLNNDTLPRSGWLPPLLRVLNDDVKAGAVGGKLLYPDGTLQEAGGAIFSDASGWNIGRGDARPERPIYNMLRQVDYCSGALLATPRALFLSLGGFDRRFAPAYYEDADYCFTLRQSGYRVFYQPESEVVHIEGVSSGTDVSAGVKKYQTTNRRNFAEKWKEILAAHPAPPPALTAASVYDLTLGRGRS